MEPQQSLQPDQPDDDPDQEADQPPPSTDLLDSALSLVAQPLASAAARVAASHPLPLPLDDLNDFNVDLSWAAPGIDSLFLNDTQYLQLGDDKPSSFPTPLPRTSLPAQASASATVTVTDAHPTQDSQSQPTTSPLDPTTSQSHPPTQNDLPSSVLRLRSSTGPQKRARMRLVQPSPKQTPVPIAPRAIGNPNAVSDLKIKSSPPTPRSTEAQSSPIHTTRPKSTPPIQSPARSPASVSRETGPAQNPPNPVAQFPLPMSTHPMMPLMNMYPLQHCQSMFHPSSSALPPTDSNTADAKLLQPAVTSDPANSNNTQMPDAHGAPSASQHHSQHPSSPHQKFLSPTMQVMPQSVVSYDASIMPFFQMAYAAAAARYPQGIIPPIPTGAPSIPSTMLHPFGPNHGSAPQNATAQNVPSPVPDTSTLSRPDQPPPTQHPKHHGAPVLIRDGGTQVLVPQQKPARLERHPVLGRLQLKSTSKQQVATSSGMSTPFVSENQTSSAEKQQGLPGSIPGPASASIPGSSPPSSRDGGQREQKRRLVWTPELHDRFVKAINAVGLSQAVPKTLVTIMNVEGLTTEHVKSHLQKYRNSLRKEAAEEDRDRSRCAGPPRGHQNIKLGTPGASGASVIHSTASRNGRQLAAVGTPAGELQRLPILPSRISAFGGQEKGTTQAALETKVSIQATKPSSSPQPAVEHNQHRGRPHSLQLPLTPCPTRAEALRDGVGGTIVVAQPSQSPEQTDRTNTEADSSVHGGESNKDVEREATAGNAVSDGQDLDNPEGIPDTAFATSAAPEIRSAENGRSPSETQVVLQKAGADLQHGKGECSNAVGQGDKEEMNVRVSPGPVDENLASAGQSNRDLELELMKEQTQQMQLQVQMMIYRTITVEKKLQELQSERVNAETSGTADASKRSTVGEANCSEPQYEDCEMKKEQLAVSKVGVTDTTRPAAAVDRRAVGEAGGPICLAEEESGRTKKRRYGSTRNGHSEVKELLNEQMGLQKRIEDGLAMIDKRMRMETDDVKEGDDGEKNSDEERIGGVGEETDQERDGRCEGRCDLLIRETRRSIG